MNKLGDIVSVLVGVAVDKPYSYKVPHGLEVALGSIVLVPLGSRQTLGIVWGEPKDKTAHNRLKDIIKVFDCTPLSTELLKTIDFVANYTLAAKGMVLRTALPNIKALEKEKPIDAYQLTGQKPAKLTPPREKVIALLDDGLAWSKSAIMKEASVSSSVIKTMYEQNILALVKLPMPPFVKIPDPDFAPLKLNVEQSKALQNLREQKNGFSVTLLDGVTGGGKTEVFFERVADAIKANKQSLILLPEIALTKIFIERFTKRFGVAPAQWHSGMSISQRAKTWRAVMSGDAQVVIGARSALFLPFHQLALIVVDEEHDGAYKQTDGISYNARDMAIVRAKFADAKIILSSATPSVESVYNALSAKYHHVQLKSRFANAAMPDINLIDMKNANLEKGSWIAPILQEEISKNLKKDEQTLLFLNRRGYAPMTLCKACGYQIKCENCSTWLVEHQKANILMCHHCGLTIKKPKKCPHCEEVDCLVPIGPGIERIGEEVKQLFPDARQIMLSSDLGSVESIKQSLEAIEKGEYDIIIGTQLIAKGHHFEKLTLVGVIDADLGLDKGDPRAGEKTFQILTQVSGRSGRADKAGRAYLQTYHPTHQVMQAMKQQNSEEFYAYEIKMRQEGGLPPFGRLAALIISGDNHKEVLNYARALLLSAPKIDTENEKENFKIFGPIDAPLAMVRGRHRIRLLVQSEKSFNLSSYVRFWLEKAEKTRGSLRVQIDIDPISFF
jgi:primosomal protein N' (replication factor Y)